MCCGRSRSLSLVLHLILDLQRAVEDPGAPFQLKGWSLDPEDFRLWGPLLLRRTTDVRIDDVDEELGVVRWRCEDCRRAGGPAIL